jgi:small ligand-binding sensory domain FIST
MSLMVEAAQVQRAKPAGASALALGADLAAAARRSVGEALESLAGRTPDLAMVFVTGAFGGGDDDDVSAALRTASALSGATTTLGCVAQAGLLAGARGVERQPGVCVWLLCLPGVRLRAFHLEVLRTSATIAVVGMPPWLPDDKVGVVLADSWSFPIEGFVDHSMVSYPGLALVGGLAAGAKGPGSTRLLLDGRVVDRGAVGVMVSGDVSVLTAVSQGCRPVGPALTVTGVDGNLLQSLAGGPALDRLEQLVAGLDPLDQALASDSLHLGIVRDEYVADPEQGDYVVRGILGVDRASGAVAVGDAVEVGQTVRFQVRDATAADADLVTTLGHLLREVPASGAAGVMVFSSNVRGRRLFASADHDAATVQRAFPGAPVAGFFTEGEIGPVAGRNLLHGHSASLVVFGGADGPGVG